MSRVTWFYWEEPTGVEGNSYDPPRRVRRKLHPKRRFVTKYWQRHLLGTWTYKQLVPSDALDKALELSRLDETGGVEA